MITTIIKFTTLACLGYVSQMLIGLGILYLVGIINANLPTDQLSLDDFVNMLTVSVGDNYALLRAAIATAVALATVKTSPTIVQALLKTVLINGSAIGLVFLITIIAA